MSVGWRYISRNHCTITFVEVILAATMRTNQTNVHHDHYWKQLVLYALFVMTFLTLILLICLVFNVLQSNGQIESQWNKLSDSESKETGRICGRIKVCNKLYFWIFCYISVYMNSASEISVSISLVSAHYCFARQNSWWKW